MTKEELIRDEDYSETDAEIMVLKNKLDKANERIEELENVLDEIREYIDKEFYTIQGVIVVEPDDIKEILDKVKQ